MLFQERVRSRKALDVTRRSLDLTTLVAKSYYSSEVQNDLYLAQYIFEGIWNFRGYTGKC